MQTNTSLLKQFVINESAEVHVDDETVEVFGAGMTPGQSVHSVSLVCGFTTHSVYTCIEMWHARMNGNMWPDISSYTTERVKTKWILKKS